MAEQLRDRLEERQRRRHQNRRQRRRIGHRLADLRQRDAEAREDLEEATAKRDELVKRREEAREGGDADRVEALNTRIDELWRVVEKLRELRQLIARRERELRSVRGKLRQRTRQIRRTIRSLARRIRRRRRSTIGVGNPGPSAWAGCTSILEREVSPVYEAAGIGETSGKRPASHPLSQANPPSDHNEANRSADARDYGTANNVAVARRVADRLDIDYDGIEDDYRSFYVVRASKTFRCQPIIGTHGTGPHTHWGFRHG